MIERRVMKNDVRILCDRRVGRCEPRNVRGLPEDDALSVIELVWNYSRLRNPAKIRGCGEDRRKAEDYDILECGEEEPAGLPVRVGRAMIIICFPIGFTGECKYSHIRKEYIFSRLFTVSGMNLGLQSTIS